MFHFAFVAAGGERFADRIRARAGVFIATSLTGGLQAEALTVRTTDFEIVVETPQLAGVADFRAALAE